jgi:Reverse transcriptase (RNA-dependent DNA polymerase)
MIQLQKKTYISRDVAFIENEPFFQDKNDHDPCTIDHAYPILPQLYGLDTLQNLDLPNNDHEHESHTRDEEEVSEDVDAHEGEIEVRRSSRIPQPSTRLKDFITYKVQYPINNFISYHNISSRHISFLTSISQEREPYTYHEAIKYPTWCKAMKEELEALKKNKTWEIVELPKGHRPVGCKWVYKIKYNGDGTIERYKARLVAKGYTQTHGIDFQETFAPVAKMNTVRILISIAVNQGWNLYQMDVRNAFLQGTLEEEVYMDLPPGHDRERDSNLACKLIKSIYGLKQSPRAWYEKLSSFLISCNFKISNSDHSLFININNSHITIILVYVDDIIVTGNNENNIELIKGKLKNKFDIKDLGFLKYFLGIEIAHSHGNLFLSQRKYVLDLLKETGKIGCKPSSTPIDSKNK